MVASSRGEEGVTLSAEREIGVGLSGRMSLCLGHAKKDFPRVDNQRKRVSKVLPCLGVVDSVMCQSVTSRHSQSSRLTMVVSDRN